MDSYQLIIVITLAMMFPGSLFSDSSSLYHNTAVSCNVSKQTNYIIIICNPQHGLYGHGFHYLLLSSIQVL